MLDCETARWGEELVDPVVVEFVAQLLGPDDLRACGFLVGSFEDLSEYVDVVIGQRRASGGWLAPFSGEPDVVAFPGPRCGHVQQVSRRTFVGEEDGLVDGAALGAVDRRSVPVAELVVGDRVVGGQRRPASAIK